jgi:hypothetical protein
LVEEEQGEAVMPMYIKLDIDETGRVYLWASDTPTIYGLSKVHGWSPREVLVLFAAKMVNEKSKAKE